MPVLDFWFDVVCPYAYLASTRVEGLAAEAGLRVRWRPILLGGLLKAHGTDPFPMSTMPAGKRALVRTDILRRAVQLGEPLRLPADHPRRTVEAMRSLAGLPEDQVPAAARAMFRAYWTGGDWPPALPGPGDGDALRRNTAEAHAAGVFGVPTLRVDGGPLHWGVDRMDGLRRALGLRVAPLPPPSDAPVELLFDFASPFAYLAAARAAELSTRVTFTPILLGALFREIGTPDVPLHAFSAARAAWTRADLEASAAAAGIPFRFASTFPLRTVLPLRVALVEPATIPAIFRAAWADDRDIGDPAVLRDVLAPFGADRLLAAADAQRDALRANTARAQALGVHGVPTWLVGDGAGGASRFWGQDRLAEVALALRGGSLTAPDVSDAAA